MTLRNIVRMVAVLGVLSALAMSAGADWFSGPEAAVAPSAPSGHHGGR